MKRGDRAEFKLREMRRDLVRELRSTNEEIKDMDRELRFFQTALRQAQIKAAALKRHISSLNELIAAAAPGEQPPGTNTESRGPL